MANAIAAATKGEAHAAKPRPLADHVAANVSKSIVEGAIARGQGRSLAGARLEAATIEMLLPPNVALIVDIETDNRQRTVSEVRHAVKTNGGVVGSTAFFFSRRGRIILSQGRGAVDLSTVIGKAIELEGIEDVEKMPSGEFLVWTQPAYLMTITGALPSQLGMQVVDADIIWAPNPDATVAMQSQDMVERLDRLLSSIREYPEVKAVFANVWQGSVRDDEWNRIARHIEA